MTINIGSIIYGASSLLPKIISLAILAVKDFSFLAICSRLIPKFFINCWTSIIFISLSVILYLVTGIIFEFWLNTCREGNFLPPGYLYKKKVPLIFIFSCLFFTCFHLNILYFTIGDTFAIYDNVYLIFVLNLNTTGALSVMILQQIAPLLFTIYFSILSITRLNKIIEYKKNNYLNTNLTEQHLQKIWKEHRETSVTGNGL
jgi:hypothetical protein